MNLKQRLIGAAVLIALAVIFVPMLLDGAGRQEQLKLRMEIPPEPEFSFKYHEPPPPRTLSPAPESPEAARVATPGPATATSVRTTSSPETEAVPKSRVSPPPVAPTKSRPVAEAPAARTRSTASVSKSGWVVQMGSFSREANARSLMADLRKAGYAVLIERRGSQQRPSYRVKVGPVTTRDQANALKASLKKTSGIDGIVMSFPADDS